MPKTFRLRTIAAALILLMGSPQVRADDILISGQFHHLRSGGGETPEWTDFPKESEGSRLALQFESDGSAAASLLLRQRDVKQVWSVILNGRKLGLLVRDENAMRILLEIPGGVLRSGDNELVVESKSKSVDDIRIGDLRVVRSSPEAWLGESRVHVDVIDGDTQRPIPARITILDAEGDLVPVHAPGDPKLAVRHGTVYTASGSAEFALHAGKYRLIAGHGFEYGIAEVRVDAEAAGRTRLRMEIRREVDTKGLVACDTHIHTLTHSGHGDASIEERIVTIAAEGIELPVATDHNLHIDYEPIAKRLGVRRWFTPLIGNEFTTPVGHFNFFPVDRGAKVPVSKVKNWKQALANIAGVPGVRVVVLNHPRGLHSNFRPFGPLHHLSTVGENTDGWSLDVTAMELLNSAAMQSDSMRLVHDWFGHLNGGRKIVPVGASDSHDVSRHFVGQGRTYIECPDDDPGAIDVAHAMESLGSGRVSVSMGLLARMSIDTKYGPGDLVPANGGVIVRARVLGPGWTMVDRVMLFANGILLREESIPPERGSRAGEKWSGEWKLPAFVHDVHLVLIATGPGVESLHWRVPKSYQPSSSEWNGYVFSATGAVYLDADGDGEFSSARDIARNLLGRSKGDTSNLLSLLRGHDEAVAAQVAHLSRTSGQDLNSPAWKALLEREASDETRRGFHRYLEEYHRNLAIGRAAKVDRG